MTTTSTKTLNLRGLSDSERDARVNEAVAVHVAKLPNMHWIDHVHVYGGEYPDVRSVPDYATSCDAVMPLLEKQGWFPVIQRPYDSLKSDCQRVWEVELLPAQGYWGVRVEAATLPLAACICLLRANGWEVLT